MSIFHTYFEDAATTDPSVAVEFFETHKNRLKPEKRLMLAVFIGALVSLKKYYCRHQVPCYKIKLEVDLSKDELRGCEFHEALDWFFRDDPEDIFSFVSICETFGFRKIRWRAYVQGELAKQLKERFRFDYKRTV